ncbi:sporulation histidine kinase inhibitor Sda [Bacillus altitudinis]|nr:sporulation histidine kinase inhibitor Sda [Bacillus altitudinis]
MEWYYKGNEMKLNGELIELIEREMKRGWVGDMVCVWC